MISPLRPIRLEVLLLAALAGCAPADSPRPANPAPPETPALAAPPPAATAAYPAPAASGPADYGLPAAQRTFSAVVALNGDGKFGPTRVFDFGSTPGAAVDGIATEWQRPGGAMVEVPEGYYGGTDGARIRELVDRLGLAWVQSCRLAHYTPPDGCLTVALYTPGAFPPPEHRGPLIVWKSTEELGHPERPGAWGTEDLGAALDQIERRAH